MASNTQNRAVKAATAMALAVSLAGCADLGKDAGQWVKNLADYPNLRNGFLDPSQVGRFDKAKPWGFSKPVTWPILDKLDMIDEPNEHWTMASDPLPGDLVVEQKEYVLAEGDVITVSVFELVTPGLPYNDQKTINELGKVTLQNLGQVDVSGLTPTQLEAKIGQLAVDKGFLLPKGNGSPGPQVSVQLMQSRARVFSLLGQVQAAGTYNIIGTDFRLLDALALGRDIAGLNQPGMDYLYVIRPQKNAGVIPAASQPPAAPATNPLKALDTLKPGAAAPAMPASPVGDGPTLLRPLPQVVTLADIPETPKVLAQADLDAAISGGTSVMPASAPARVPESAPATPPAAQPAPVAPAATEPVDLSQAVGGTTSKPGMIFVNGKWVEANPGAATSMTPGEAEATASSVSIPRVIRIPISKLKEGDPRYNVVIRPGDIINVPNIEPGEFYLLGHVNRPGVYSLTGRKVTLKQAVAAAGGLDQVAIPRRCDLIRRIGTTEVTVQVDLQRIFDGEQPDIFLKSNDLVNVGTDMIAPFLAVTRNAYRASYGWGFTYDRNFYIQPTLSLTPN